ncbi:unnamed protein product [Caenorhabditis auriculariae]|uniref:Uncharacterized protein n=1 Tax=Caenorhabditis auriculariae TaxID=2777116 RepID=A0A8S1H9B0_9PELO|nr:unnamed protein product [Caenorhabditis auriculariae]
MLSDGRRRPRTTTKTNRTWAVSSKKLITDAVSVFKQQPRREASDFVGLPVPHGAASDEVLAPVNVESPIWTAVTSTPRLAAGIDEWSPNGMMTTKNFLLGTLELFEAEASVSHSETQNAPLNEKKKIKSRINLGEIVVSGQSPVRLVSEKPENFTAQSIVVPFTTLNSPRFIVSPISFDGPVTEHSDLSNSIPSCSTSPPVLPPAESEIFSNITITRGRQTRPFEDETYVNTEEYFTPMFRRNRPLGQKVRISPPDAALFHRAGYNPVDTIYRNQNFNNRQKREYAKQMILQKARESRADQKNLSSLK